MNDGGDRVDVGRRGFEREGERRVGLSSDHVAGRIFHGPTAGRFVEVINISQVESVHTDLEDRRPVHLRDRRAEDGARGDGGRLDVQHLAGDLRAGARADGGQLDGVIARRAWQKTECLALPGRDGMPAQQDRPDVRRRCLSRFAADGRPADGSPRGDGARSVDRQRKTRR